MGLLKHPFPSSTVPVTRFVAVSMMLTVPEKLFTTQASLPSGFTATATGSSKLGSSIVATTVLVAVSMTLTFPTPKMTVRIPTPARDGAVGTMPNRFGTYTRVPEGFAARNMGVSPTPMAL